VKRAWLALALLLSSGCELFLHVDSAKTTESTSALCSDRIDNDSNGLVDCQDFHCLGTAPCCNQPLIEFDDDFHHAPACGSQSCVHGDPACQPDPSKWDVWGTPMPVVCENALVPLKTELCYDVGALAKIPLALHPGLKISVDVTGQPEIAGELVVALTQQSIIQGGPQPCLAQDPLVPALAARMVATSNGYQVIATRGSMEIGASTEVTLAQSSTHKIIIYVDNSWQVNFALDDTRTVFATRGFSSGDPDIQQLHLAVAGRSLSARFAKVRVDSGTQCESPSAWMQEPDMGLIALAPSPIVAADGGATLDSLDVKRPAVQVREGGTVGMVYTGCHGSSLSPSACVQGFIIGDAVRAGGGTFERAAPLYPGILDGADADASYARTKRDGSLAQPRLLVISSPVDSLLAVGSDLSGTWMVQQGFGPLSFGPLPSWWTGTACCGSELVGDDGTIEAWVSASDADHTFRRIGYLTSPPGALSFTTHADAALSEGGSNDLDALGVSDPEVLFDRTRSLYRMWYVMYGPLGGSAIGYAVSTDGASWYKFPGNPVVTAEQFGLESIGAPTVLQEEDRLRMYLHGRTPGLRSYNIYSIINVGVAPAQ
jgi:hypothetical protein